MSCYRQWHAQQTGISDPEQLARWSGVDPNHISPVGLESQPIELLHLVLDALDAQTVPETYYQKVMESRRRRGWAG